MGSASLYQRAATCLRKGLYSTLFNPWIVGLYDRINQPVGLGERGERIARRFLLTKGYIVIEQGHHGSHGEIDLIAVDNRTIVFVEVKTRSSDYAGDPSEAVDAIKQKRISETAKGYLKWHHLIDKPFRFDVISVIWTGDSARPEIRHYVSAFEPSGKSQLF